MRKRMLMIVVGAAALVALALGGAAIAGRAGAFDDGSPPVAAPESANARAAALAITNGGTVNSVERDSENGATYEVEVTKPDGKTVDVRLDGSYALVVVEGDSEAENTSGG